MADLPMLLNMALETVATSNLSHTREGIATCLELYAAGTTSTTVILEGRSVVLARSESV